MQKNFLYTLLLLPIMASATVYQSRDAQGNVTFSDIPSTNSTTVTVTPAQIFQPPVPNNTNVDQNQNNNNNNNSNIVVYKKFSIVLPAATPDGTIRDNNGTVEITVVMDPMLSPSDKIAIYLDEKPLGKPQSTNMFVLQNIDRGTHTLQAKIVTDKGVVVMQSKPVTFHMHRALVTPNGVRSQNTIDYLEQQGYSKNEAMQQLADAQSALKQVQPPQLLNEQNPAAQVQLPLTPLDPKLNQITKIINNNPVAVAQNTQGGGGTFQGQTPNYATQGSLPDGSHYSKILQGQTPDLQKQGTAITSNSPTIITRTPMQQLKN